MYPYLPALTGAREIRVPLAEGWVHDLDAMATEVTAATQLLIVCNPNNPTATHLPAAEIGAFCERIPPHVTVILDEAYIEFQTDDDPDATLDLLADFPNLVVLRTFSKAYGLAGLRVGYAIGSSEFRAAVDAVRQPFSVNALAQAAGAEAIRHQDDVLRRVESTVAERLRVEEELHRDRPAHLRVAGELLLGRPRRGRRSRGPRRPRRARDRRPARRRPRRTRPHPGQLRHPGRGRPLPRRDRRADRPESPEPSAPCRRTRPPVRSVRTSRRTRARRHGVPGSSRRISFRLRRADGTIWHAFPVAAGRAATCWSSPPPRRRWPRSIVAGLLVLDVADREDTLRDAETNLAELAPLAAGAAGRAGERRRTRRRRLQRPRRQSRRSARAAHRRRPRTPAELGRDARTAAIARHHRTHRRPQRRRRRPRAVAGDLAAAQRRRCGAWCRPRESLSGQVRSARAALRAEIDRRQGEVLGVVLLITGLVGLGLVAADGRASSSARRRRARAEAERETGAGERARACRRWSATART